MSDTIKCVCDHCGAKYRLPIDTQGRKAKCKRCGERFEVPKAESQSLEDSIMLWLSGEDDEEVVTQPRVINMPTDQRIEENSDAGRRLQGPIRMKSANGASPTPKSADAVPANAKK